jgi:NADPH2:quinone reductase
LIAETAQKLTYRRVVVTRHGGPEVLQMVEEEMPTPGPGQVGVKVLAAGVSAYDLMHRSSGSVPGSPKPPFTQGEDVVGLVDQLGPGVSDLAKGQMVAGYPRGGGYTEYICLPADEVAPVPDGVDPAEAVCLVANYLTAHMMLHATARVVKSERILVHGAAGGVGSALLELGRLAGLEMYGTASARNHELVAGFGATPIDYRNEDFVRRIRELTGDGVDVVFDPIGGARQVWRSYRALRRGGRLMWFGVAAAKTSGLRTIPLTLLMIMALKLFPGGKQVPLTPNLAEFAPADWAWCRDTLGELLDLLAKGKIKPLVAARIPLAEAPRAHELLERGGYAGKVVLVAGD